MNEPSGMSNLIEALQIFLKHGDLAYPTNCSHDVLAIMGIEQEVVSEEDTKRLETLGFFYSEEHECFISYRFGSA